MRTTCEIEHTATTFVWDVAVYRQASLPGSLKMDRDGKLLSKLFFSINM
jgi:hypothetical protein